MKLILENPFRILGLPVTASNKQLSKRISELNMYSELGKSASYDTDFSWLSKWERDAELIQDAARKIEQPDKKFFHALFWFWNTTSADKLALDVLKSGELDKAVALWRQVIEGKDLSPLNFSCHINMSTLYLAFAVKGKGFNSKYLDASLDYAVFVLTSNMLKEFASKVSSVPFSFDQKELVLSRIKWVRICW